MREIKFRAWDKKYKHMGYDGTLTYKGKDFQSCRCWDEFEIMQFTGLKDKNGKEIYEGDIVEWIIIGEKDEDVEGIRVAKKMGIYEVFFENGKFIIPKPPIPIGHINTECKVIGNIYENPELIK